MIHHICMYVMIQSWAQEPELMTHTSGLAVFCFKAQHSNKLLVQKKYAQEPNVS